MSAGVGFHPRWSGDGSELYYFEGNTMVAVPVSTDPSFSAGPAQRLFQYRDQTAEMGQNYDVSADGRFVVVEPAEDNPEPTIRVVQNWFEEFRDRE